MQQKQGSFQTPTNQQIGDTFNQIVQNWPAEICIMICSVTFSMCERPGKGRDEKQRSLRSSVSTDDKQSVQSCSLVPLRKSVRCAIVLYAERGNILLSYSKKKNKRRNEIFTKAISAADRDASRLAEGTQAPPRLPHS